MRRCKLFLVASLCVTAALQPHPISAQEVSCGLVFEQRDGRMVDDTIVCNGVDMGRDLSLFDYQLHPDEVVARGAFNSEDRAKALQRLEQLVAEQDTYAMVYLGIMHRYGLGTEKNFDEAVRLYETAADRGNAKAQADLGESSLITQSLLHQQQQQRNSVAAVRVP